MFVSFAILPVVYLIYQEILHDDSYPLAPSIYELCNAPVYYVESHIRHCRLNNEIPWLLLNNQKWRQQWLVQWLPMDFVKSNFLHNSPTPCALLMESINAFVANDLQCHLVANNICSSDRSMLGCSCKYTKIFGHDNHFEGKKLVFLMTMRGIVLYLQNFDRRLVKCLSSFWNGLYSLACMYYSVV